MDDIVKAALAKWPNVPDCYGWLALDARGNWRMRDERAQMLRLPGERIANAALIGFINRNYTRDKMGRWYFQNGPQRVYVTLEATPYIARTIAQADPQPGFVLHTGEALATLDEAWLTDTGTLVVRCGEKIAALDDRDMAQCLPLLQFAGMPASDERLLDWLEQGEAGGVPTLRFDSRTLPLRRIARDALAAHFAYVPDPQPAAAD